MNALTDLQLTSYAITAYTPGKSGIVGYRTVPVTFKTDKKEGSKTFGIKRDSVAASLPVISKDAIVSNISVLVECVKAWCEDTQDKIVRECVLAGKSSIEANEIDLAAIAAFMRESMTSGRLSGEMLTDWFTEQMEPMLTDTLAKKLGITEQSEPALHTKLETMVTVYKTKLVALASGRTKYDKPEALQLIKAFEVCGMVAGFPVVDSEGEPVIVVGEAGNVPLLTTDTEDDIGSKLLAKLRGMAVAPELVDQYGL